MGWERGMSGWLISMSVELLWSVGLRMKFSYVSFGSMSVWLRNAVTAGKLLTEGSSCGSFGVSNDILIRLSCLSLIVGEIGTICVILVLFDLAWP